MKRLLAITLTFILVLSLMSVASFTASALTEGDYEYNLIDNPLDNILEVQITKYTGSGGDVVIPSIIAGMPVTDICINAFANNCSLTSISIPASVTKIGKSFASNFATLEYLFGNATDLKSITVESGNPVYHSDGNCLIETGSKTLIAGCQNSVIPTDDSVTSIGERAFYECNSLTDITIPGNIASIGEYAFRYCYWLDSVTFLEGVTSIGDGAFDGCDLTTVTLPVSVTSIGEEAFDMFYQPVIIYPPSDEKLPMMTVYYSGTQADRDKIKIGFGNDDLLNATWVYGDGGGNGDATGDGSVDMKDVLTIRKTIAGLGGDVDKSAADVDGDGELTMKDVLMIRKFIAGLIDKLGK